jgi:hypothetical protein
MINGMSWSLPVTRLNSKQQVSCNTDDDCRVARAAEDYSSPTGRTVRKTLQSHRGGGFLNKLTSPSSSEELAVNLSQPSFFGDGNESQS